MTEGSIIKSIMLFSIPLLIGNLFQQLYNTADSVIAGNFIGKEALAAVGSSNSLINLIIGLFIGISTGAGVIIAQYYGAKDEEKMQMGSSHIDDAQHYRRDSPDIYRSIFIAADSKGDGNSSGSNGTIRNLS